MGVVHILLQIVLVGVVLGEPAGLLQANVPGNVNPSVLNRQQGGLSFVIPGLSLLGGNNGIGGGNLFGTVTVTRTVVSTVSTVTTASFRTCIGPTNAVPPCAAGRKKRHATSYPMIQPTSSMALIIGGTTLLEPFAVSQYLENHRPHSQSVIYPPGMEYYGRKLELDQLKDDVATTPLYSSHDTPEEFYDPTTITPELLDDESSTSDTTEGQDDFSLDKARRGLGRTTTVTSVIKVTSVATSIATGMTVTVMYAGCLPPVLPISGQPCQ